MTKQQSASKVKQAKRKWDFKIIEVLYAQKCRVIHSIKGLFEINENVSLSCKPKTKGFRFYVFRLAIVNKIQKLHKSIISEWSLTFLKYVKRTNAKL